MKLDGNASTISLTKERESFVISLLELLATSGGDMDICGEALKSLTLNDGVVSDSDEDTGGEDDGNEEEEDDEEDSGLSISCGKPDSSRSKDVVKEAEKEEEKRSFVKRLIRDDRQTSIEEQLKTASLKTAIKEEKRKAFQETKKATSNVNDKKSEHDKTSATTTAVKLLPSVRVQVYLDGKGAATSKLMVIGRSETMDALVEKARYVLFS